MSDATHPIHPDIQLLDGGFYADDPHPLFAWMRENAPVYRDPESGIWGISLHEDVMACSKDNASFSNAQGMRPDYGPVPNMICMDDPEHKRRRNLVNRGFTPRRVDDQEAKIRAFCRELVDKALERGEVDFVRDVAAPLPMMVIGDMLGVRPEDRERLLYWSDTMMEGLTGSSDLDNEKFARMMAVGDEWTAYATDVIADRRRRPLQDDLVSILCHAEIDGERLDDAGLREEMLLILIGGDETTRHVITGGMHQLLLHPEQRDRLVADPSGIPMAIEEMLRWVTPIQNMARTCTRDVELRGQTLKAGEKLILLYPSANRDERVFDDPYVFDTRRTPNPHVAFGGYGSHFCLGAPLARLEMRVMFEEVLARMPRLELASSEAPALRPANFITGIEQLPVRCAP